VPPDTTVDDRLVELGVDADAPAGPEDPEVDDPDVVPCVVVVVVVVAAAAAPIRVDEPVVVLEAGPSLATRMPMARDAPPATPATHRDVRRTRLIAWFLCSGPGGGV
jgi:hypothetical protein